MTNRGPAIDRGDATDLEYDFLLKDVFLRIAYEWILGGGGGLGCSRVKRVEVTTNLRYTKIRFFHVSMAWNEISFKIPTRPYERTGFFP